MKKIYIFAFSFLLFLLGNQTFLEAQNLYSEKEFLLNGKEDLKAQKYRSALYFFEEITKNNPSNQEAMYYAAICKLHLYLLEEALQDLKKVNLESLSEDTDYYYWVGEAYFLNESFKDALDMLKNYKNQKEREKPKSYDLLLQRLQKSIELYSDPENYLIRNMGNHINSPFHDFGVSKIPKSENVMYSSNRLSFKNKLSDRYDTEILTLYKARIEKSGTVQDIEVWNESKSLDSQFKVLQILKYELTSSDKTFLITQNGQLKTLRRIKGEWQIPELFSTSLSKEKGTQEYAYLSKDEKVIIFASDYKSKGNYELFVSFRENKDSEFEKSKSLENLNSKFNEITPFLDNKNTLYFSSNRDTTAGGYDIFKAEFDKEKQSWETPTLLPYPINSVADELYFSLDEEMNNQIGYFVSNRIGGEGGNDIYQVFLFDSAKVSGQFRERTLEKQPIAGAEVVFKSQNYSIDSLIYKTQTDSVGNYQINLPVFFVSINEKAERVYQETSFVIEIYYEKSLTYQDRIFLQPYHLAKKNTQSYTINAYLYVPPEQEE